jgi:hypothetical protein
LLLKFIALPLRPHLGRDFSPKSENKKLESFGIQQKRIPLQTIFGYSFNLT